jgi:hypothetical protein
MEFELIIGFIGTLQLVTTSNYSALSTSRARLLIIVHAKPSRCSLSSSVVVW